MDTHPDSISNEKLRLSTRGFAVGSLYFIKKYCFVDKPERFMRL